MRSQHVLFRGQDNPLPVDQADYPGRYSGRTIKLTRAGEVSKNNPTRLQAIKVHSDYGPVFDNIVPFVPGYYYPPRTR
jgi:hypothetical protein